MAGSTRQRGPYPSPGTVISVPAYVLFRHTGIVSDHYWNGAPMVIANSFRHGGVAEVPWDEFAQGQEWKDEGYPSQLPACIVLARARSKLGESYKAFTFNCEHFTRFCHALPIESGQVAFVLAAALLAAFLASASK